MLHNQLLAPKDGQCHGSLKKLPRDYDFTVVIPNFECVEMLEASVNLWREASPQPYIIIIDTGSCVSTVKRIEELRGNNCEIHYLRAHSWMHPSEPVSMAMDLATMHCQTKWMMATHADCFPRARDLFDQFRVIAEEQESPCVGYQITDRPHWVVNGERCHDSDWMVGHTMTLIDRDYFEKNRILWSLRAGCATKGWDISLHGNPVNKPNVIDTEVFINYELKRLGKPPVLIGDREENYVRNVNQHFDHVRSAPSAMIYAKAGSVIRRNQVEWKGKAIALAKSRLKRWKEVA